MRIQWTKRAKKDLDKLPTKIKQQIKKAFKKLESQNLNEVAKELDLRKLRGYTNPLIWRIRVGDYRIFATLTTDKIITLSKI